MKWRVPNFQLNPVLNAWAPVTRRRPRDIAHILKLVPVRCLRGDMPVACSCTLIIDGSRPVAGERLLCAP